MDTQLALATFAQKTIIQSAVLWRDSLIRHDTIPTRVRKFEIAKKECYEASTDRATGIASLQWFDDLKSALDKFDIRAHNLQ